MIRARPPGKIDKAESVKVSTVVTGPFDSYENGKKITYDKVILTDHVKLLPDSVTQDTLSFLVVISVELVNSSKVYNDYYYDDAFLIVNIVNGIVTVPVDSIENKKPIVLPESGTSASGATAVWIPDKTGVINVTSASGFLADTTVVIFVTQSGTVGPKWQVSDPILGNYQFGGDPVDGWPPSFSFSTRQQEQRVIDVGTPGVTNYAHIGVSGRH